MMLIVGWNEMENGGCIQLEKAELEEFVATTGSNRKLIILASQFSFIIKLVNRNKTRNEDH
jgi:hypothetical protein